MESDDDDDFAIFEGKTANVDYSKIKKPTRKRPQEDPVAPIAKAPRKTKESVVIDSFETEAQTEYLAAKIDAETGEAAQDEKLVLAHNIRHQVALPPDYPYVPIQQHKSFDPPNRTYPFKLDPFQQTAVSSIERNESVLVAAHTSAGKTVIAEYAIATALKHKQRVIYTSPIKALSNQKYREMKEIFGDVGLMTGDITIDPSSSCLIMTTEILRSMMYRGSEIMREVAWVIFDEIHYMRDLSRGVVWEETIILLPHKVRYAFLSATIPNAKQFAEWICHIHNQPCHVVYTDFRPVPLQHYVFASGGDGIHLCVDEKSVFREQNFLKAVSSLTSGPQRGDDRGRKGGKKDLKGQTDLFKIVKMIWQRAYQPVIVFSFSKRDCESYALQMSKLNFNDDTEKSLVTQIYENALAGLADEDRELPQIQHLLPLLQRGIGIHHSGLLQILKEVIEILFQEGLIKVLFATETFSIGLNMPAKTVVFTSVEKFDGKQTRPLGSGEYIQMSGRAGRRGLDDRGIVIMMVNQKMEPEVARNMLKGEPDVLNSAFHLTYSMIINLMRVEGISPDYILERSFYQFQNSEALPEFEDKLSDYESERSKIVIKDESVVAEYYLIQKQLNDYKNDIRTVITHPSNCLQFLQPGRLVHIKYAGRDYGWSILVNFTKKAGRKPKNGEQPEVTYTLDVLARCAEGYAKQLELGEIPPPCPEDMRGEMLIIPIGLTDVQELSAIKMHLPKDLRNSESRMNTLKSITEIGRRFDGKVPILDPVEDMNIKDAVFADLLTKVDKLESSLLKNPLSNPDKAEAYTHQYQQYMKKVELNDKITLLRREIKEAKSILQLDELKYRKRVLRVLGYVNDSEVVEVKGRVACEITVGDELVLAELLFNGVFNDLTTPQIVGLLSCFVCQEPSNDEDVKPRDDMQPLIKILRETARKVAQVSIDSKLALDEEEYVQSFKSDMVNPLYAWAEGAKFAEICKLTNVFEGSIIRMIRRLEELLRQMCAASKQIGNADLELKFATAGAKIKHGIVFAASLYL